MSFKDLMYSMIGSPGAAQNVSLGSALGSTMTTTAGQGMLAQMSAAVPPRKTASKKVFSGNIEVQHVANGYVVHIGTRDGYEYETHIAASITEVNEIIAAQIVAFRLEDKA